MWSSVERFKQTALFVLVATTSSNGTVQLHTSRIAETLGCIFTATDELVGGLKQACTRLCARSLPLSHLQRLDV